MCWLFSLDSSKWKLNSNKIVNFICIKRQCSIFYKSVFMELGYFFCVSFVLIIFLITLHLSNIVRNVSIIAIFVIFSTNTNIWKYMYYLFSYQISEVTIPLFHIWKVDLNKTSIFSNSSHYIEYHRTISCRELWGRGCLQWWMMLCLYKVLWTSAHWFVWTHWHDHDSTIFLPFNISSLFKSLCQEFTFPLPIMFIYLFIYI